MPTANETQAKKWCRMAKEAAAMRMGSAAALMTPEVRNALACAHLVAIFAGLDDEHRNAATMAFACELLLQET